MRKHWPKVLLSLLAMLILFGTVSVIATAFIAKNAMDNFESDCRTFSKSVYNMETFLETKKNVNDDVLATVCEQVLGKNCKAYIVDKRGNVLATTDKSVKFDADGADKTWIYDVDESVSATFDDTVSFDLDMEGEGIAHPDNVNLNLSGSMDEMMTTFRRFQQLLKKEGTLLYRKAYKEEGENLYVQVPATISTQSLQSIVAAAATFLLIIILFFIVIIVFLITQWTSKAKLFKLAYLDRITGGINWARFKELGKKRIRNKNRQYAMVVYESDSYAVMKEMYGHKKCEELLKELYRKAMSLKRRKELVTRVQENRFVMLLEYESERVMTTRLNDMAQEFIRQMPSHFIKLHFGVIVVDDKKISFERMLNYAVLAQQKSLEPSEDNIQYFHEELREKMLKEKELEDKMEEAMENREFKMFLQPKYTSDGKHVHGAEALVRWISPSMGFISPGEFIPLFERNQFIRKLDEYMLRRVCEFQKKRFDEGREMIIISVNVSRVNLSNPQLVDIITGIVDEYQLPYEYVELELTESMFFDDKEVLVDTITRLRQNGFSVSMDDFGSGYSSLNSLKDLRLDVIKLDAEFFRGKEDDKERSTIVVSDTIAMAKHLNMKIVAEGIETKEQVDFLNEIGCDLIQGFYFAKPMEETDFVDLLGE